MTEVAVLYLATATTANNNYVALAGAYDVYPGKSRIIVGEQELLVMNSTAGSLVSEPAIALSSDLIVPVVGGEELGVTHPGTYTTSTTTQTLASAATVGEDYIVLTNGVGNPGTGVSSEVVLESITYTATLNGSATIYVSPTISVAATSSSTVEIIETTTVSAAAEYTITPLTDEYAGTNLIQVSSTDIAKVEAGDYIVQEGNTIAFSGTTTSSIITTNVSLGGFIETSGLMVVTGIAVDVAQVTEIVAENNTRAMHIYGSNA